jgi:hypothetical protein
MGRSVAQQLIDAHLVSGEMAAVREIGIRVDQTLTQDATGTLVMLRPVVFQAGHRRLPPRAHAALRPVARLRA